MQQPGARRQQGTQPKVPHSSAYGMSRSLLQQGQECSPAVLHVRAAEVPVQQPPKLCWGLESVPDLC